MEELSEIDWEKKISIIVFMVLSLQKNITVAESWHREKRELAKIFTTIPKIQNILSGGKLIKQSWIYWNLNNGYYSTLNNGLSMKALTWHLCNKSSYLTNQYRGFDFNKGDKSYSNPSQLQALNRWSSLGLYRSSTYSGCTNVSY